MEEVGMAGEEEVLLLPYSQFRVLEDAREEEGAVHIHIELVAQPLVKQLVTTSPFGRVACGV